MACPFCGARIEHNAECIWDGRRRGLTPEAARLFDKSRRFYNRSRRELIAAGAFHDDVLDYVTAKERREIRRQERARRS